MKQTFGNNMIITIMLVTAFTGWDIQHTPKLVVKAQEPIVVAPTASPKAVCSTVTPFDKEIEQVWGSESCNFKRVLRWTTEDGRVYGENTNFITKNADRVQKNGSVDRGISRINSDTFNWYMKVRAKVLLNSGISTWDDMLDPVLNIRMAKLIYTYQGWCAWYASPNDLCSKNYVGLQ